MTQAQKLSAQEIIQFIGRIIFVLGSYFSPRNFF